MCIFNGTVNTCNDGSLSFEYTCVGWNCYKTVLFLGADCTFDEDRTNVYCSTALKCDGEAKFTSAFKLGLDDEDIYISRYSTYSFDTGHHFTMSIDERFNMTSSNITDLPVPLSFEDTFDPSKAALESGPSGTANLPKTVPTSNTNNSSSTNTQNSGAVYSQQRPTLCSVFWITLLTTFLLLGGASASTIEHNHYELHRSLSESTLKPFFDQAPNVKRSAPQWYTFLQAVQSTMHQITLDQNNLALPTTTNCTTRSGPPSSWYASLTTLAIDATCEMLVDNTRTDPIALLPPSAQYPALTSLLAGNCLRKTTAKVLSLASDLQNRNETSIATRFTLAFVVEYLCDRIGGELAANPDSYKVPLCTAPFDQRPKWPSESESNGQMDSSKAPPPLKSIYSQDILCEWSMEAVAANFTQPIPGTNTVGFY